jgi:hypothetical protein
LTRTLPRRHACVERSEACQHSYERSFLQRTGIEIIDRASFPDPGTHRDGGIGAISGLMEVNQSRVAAIFPVPPAVIYARSAANDARRSSLVSATLTFSSAATDWISAIAGLAAAFAAAIGLAYAGLQLRAARRSAEGARNEAESGRRTTESQFLLALEDQFRVHWDVHVALRPGGKWTTADAGPESNEDWARVESYMGLFERLNILHRNGVLPLPYIRQFYRYRLTNLWANQVIRSEKMEARPKGWRDLIELSHKLDIAVGESLWRSFTTEAA